MMRKINADHDARGGFAVLTSNAEAECNWRFGRGT